jgi:putative RNA 2'-phosphotransferase
MDERRRVHVSKFLARHLRHRPEALGLELDPAGWVAVDALLAACARSGLELTRLELDEIVATNDKKRFAFDPAGARIRANQGHSVAVDLGLPAREPPPLLYHGTVARFLDLIEREGLLPMKRHAVHLSVDVQTARRVGSRRGPPVILAVDAAAMVSRGHRFTVSENRVWLVSSVPPEFLSRVED